MSAHFAIFKVETSGYSSIGPTAKFLNLEDAKVELERLQRHYPQLSFRIMGEVGTASRSDKVTITIESPLSDEPLPWKKRAGG